MLKRIVFAVGASVLLVAGIALLILPGPGLLLILAGLLVLAQVFPAVGKYIDPVAKRARQAVVESVSSTLRIAGSVLAGLGLIGVGVAWGLPLFPWLPLAGWSTGSSLILSGLILLVLLGYSYHQVRTRRALSG